jgi:hypothetical protein
VLSSRALYREKTRKKEPENTKVPIKLGDRHSADPGIFFFFSQWLDSP